MYMSTTACPAIMPTRDSKVQPRHSLDYIAVSKGRGAVLSVPPVHSKLSLTQQMMVSIRTQDTHVLAMLSQLGHEKPCQLAEGS